MIQVTKFDGDMIYINADHIESVESQPDTNLVLSNGKHYIVKEDLPEVIRRIMEYQRTIRTGIEPGLSGPESKQ